MSKTINQVNVKKGEKKKKIYLSFGNTVELYYAFINVKTPRQLDLIEEWLPGFLVEVLDDEKAEPEYIDHQYRLLVHRVNGSIYAGGSSGRVSQIVGRLYGTARSNLEKERKTAELIRKHIARRLITDFDSLESLQNNIIEKLSVIEEDRLEEFHGLLINTVIDLAIARSEMSDDEKDSEPFPFEDHIFDALIYNTAYQLNLFTEQGLANAYLWLLLGGFLRNEVSLLINMYHSGFVAINRKPSERNDLIDKLNYMFNPDEYCSTYEGDDLYKRFPGITWKCDNPECEAILDYQPGFDDHLHEWQCRECGHINRIEIDSIYQNEEDYLEGRDSVDSDDFEAALAERQDELTEK